MKKFLIILASLFAIILFFGTIAGIVFGLRHMKGMDIGASSKVVLEIDFSQPVIETHSNDPFQRFTTRGSMSLLDMVRAIDFAATDQSVSGIVADLSELSIGMSQLQDIRDAVKRFSAKGKWTIAYADTYLSSKTGTGVYYLASAFDEITMHPTGDVGFMGLAIEQYFVRKTLDMLGVVPLMGQRYEYKTVANMWNETGYTDAHRESDTLLIHSIFDEICQDVAESRNMTPDEIRALVDRAPFIGREALDARMVDGFRFRDEVDELMEEKAGCTVECLRMDEYFKRKVGALKTKGDYVVGLVYGLGEVVRGESSSSMTGSPLMASKVMVENFRQLREDGDVDVVVFRVNSPGGSPDASATIAHEIQLTQKAGIPVIVSMGDVAASGGYYVAMYADTIIAQPMTLTGSIGVAGGKFVIRELLAKAGITMDEIHEGENALLLSMTTEPTDSQKERFNTLMDRIYADFTSGVMEGREMTPEQIDAVARGRVWTGADALTVNLIDQLGGLHDALELARDLAEVPEGEELAVRIYPRKKTLMESLRDPGSFLTKVQMSAAILIRFINLLEIAAGSVLQDLEAAAATDVLSAPVTARTFHSDNQ